MFEYCTFLFRYDKHWKFVENNTGILNLQDCKILKIPYKLKEYYDFNAAYSKF